MDFQTQHLSARIWIRAGLGMLGILILPATVLLITAGEADWPMAWLYLAILLVTTIVSRLILLVKQPSLLIERAQFTAKRDDKAWDRVLMPWVALWGPMLVLATAALNRRFGWQPTVPGWVEWAGVAGLLVAYAVGIWALIENKFFSATVRIQTDRGHRVISSGPYHYVRHPGYASSLLGNMALPLLLGSWWALLPAAGVIGLTFLRTSLEDRTLQAELPGYPEYAHRVRYRLVPGVW